MCLFFCGLLKLSDIRDISSKISRQWVWIRIDAYERSAVARGRIDARAHAYYSVRVRARAQQARYSLITACACIMIIIIIMLVYYKPRAQGCVGGIAHMQYACLMHAAPLT